MTDTAPSRCPTLGPTCRGCPDCQGIPYDAETAAWAQAEVERLRARAEGLADKARQDALEDIREGSVSREQAVAVKVAVTDLLLDIRALEIKGAPDAE